MHLQAAQDWHKVKQELIKKQPDYLAVYDI